MHRLPSFLLGIVLLAPSVALAQQTPTLMAKNGSGSQAMELRRFQVETTIHGFMAETRITMGFHNPHDRILEGELLFPLPDGATITGLALDIHGVMVEGASVEKEQARRVFEKVVRQNIDPALAELVRGNQFKVRVYPLPARGERTVRIRYVSDLSLGPDGAFYELPLVLKQPIDELVVLLEVVRHDDSPRPRVVQGAPADLKFGPWRQSWLAKARLRKATLDKPLRIEIPSARREAAVGIERNAEGEIFFVVHDEPRPPAAVFPAPDPARITILWDASGSRGQDHKKELQFLKDWIGARENPDLEVDLILFRNAPGKAAKIQIKNRDATPLLEAISKAVYDGATCLSCLETAVSPLQPELVFLFSDGFSSYGSRDLPSFGAPLYALTAATTADFSLLRALSAKSGGRFFDLSKIDEKSAARQVGQPIFSFISAKLEGADGEVYPARPRPVDGSFFLAGRLEGARAQLTLNYGIGGQILESRSFEIDSQKATAGRLFENDWARRKLAALLLEPGNQRKKVIAHAQKYGLVSPYTSLLVLDSLEQYLQNEIRPPASLAKMRAEWDREMARRAEVTKQGEKEHLERVVEKWQEKVQWWRTRFEGRKAAPGNSGEGGGEMETARPAPMLRRIPPRENNGGDHVPSEQIPTDELSRLGYLGSVEDPATETIANEFVSLDEEIVMEDRDGQATDSHGAPRESSTPGRAKGKKKKNGNGGPEVPEPAVVLAPWNPKTPYLKALRSAPAEKAFSVYLTQRVEYGQSPAFFLDCADHFLGQKERLLGLQILSNIAEMRLDDPALLRVVAHRLSQLGEPDESIRLLEKVLELRGEEPQSYRDLALLLARKGEIARALELLAHVAVHPWDARFPSIEIIALTELNHLLRKAPPGTTRQLGLDPRLLAALPVALRIVLTWDADLTDIDLWVLEPSGEVASYKNQLTAMGGRMSSDFTGGYGPETYSLRKAVPGMYKIQTNFFGSRAQKLLGAVTLQVEIFTDYGGPNEAHRGVTLRLTEQKETIDIADLEF